MSRKYIPKITIIWTFRKQTLKECTESFIIFLERLKLFDSRLGIWFEKGKSREEGLRDKVILEYEYIKKRFCKKCNADDYPEFSFDISFWNGGHADSESYDILASIGGYKVGNNICVLTFPYEGELYEHYLIKDNWESLLALFIDQWQPDQYRDYDDNLISI